MFSSPIKWGCEAVAAAEFRDAYFIDSDPPTGRGNPDCTDCTDCVVVYVICGAVDVL